MDYLVLAAGAFASWAGVPGPGEPLLIAAAVLAAKGKLNLAAVLLVAFVASTAGGVLGWGIGVRAGRSLILRPGPLARFRRRTVERGEQVFARYPAAAVILTTSWIAGIHRVRTGPYLLWNAVGAAIWTLGVGLGAYFAGPAVVDVVNDVGWIPIVGVVLLVGVGVAIEVGIKRHRRPPPSAGPDP